MNLNPKSRSTSFWLTLIFGSLGLFYSTMSGAIALTIVAVLVSSNTGFLVVVWISAILIGDHYTQKHNQNIEKIERLARESKS